MKRICKNCDYWQAEKPYEYQGECRRYAPKKKGWPITQDIDWCGEWFNWKEYSKRG